MSENRRQILEMVAQGKVNAEEAEHLIAALEKATPSDTSDKPKYLRIMVESDEHGHHGLTKVNIRVPMQLLRAGVKLAGLIPVAAQVHVNEALKEHGMQIDLSQLKPENLEELVDHLKDLTVDVDEKSNKVKIFCE